MRRMEQLQGLRMLKPRDTVTRWEAGRLSHLEATEAVRMSERTFRRWVRRFEAEGEDGLTNHRPGRRAEHAVPSEWEKEVAWLYRGRYNAGSRRKSIEGSRDPGRTSLVGIVDDIVAANRFLRDVFVAMYNRLFAVKSELDESAFAPASDVVWRNVLCVQEERVVAPDNTVSCNGRRLQIPSHPSRRGTA